MDNLLTMDNMVGKVFRHKRLFNYVTSPMKIDGDMVVCISGSNIQQEIPIDYFKRDWKIDTTIDLSEMIAKMEAFPEETPFAVVYMEYYELDDKLEHSYLHFESQENDNNFPLWKITTCTKVVRDNIINPFTMIMPIKDGTITEITKEVELMNEIRKENEFIEFNDFQGFEFGLLKILEKKYLREI